MQAQTPPATPQTAQVAASPAAPPEVDAALRARVDQFFKLEVGGKYNQALQMVAEDTKDLFVESSKSSISGFEVKGIKYADDFSRAVVTVMVQRMLPIEGFMGHPLPMKMPSRWKVENGQWCYYVDPKLDMPMTPFGPMGMPGMGMPGVPGMAMPGAAAGGGHAVTPPPLPSNLPNPHDLAADKKSVKLKVPGPSSEDVTISNISPWAATLTLTDPKVAGLQIGLKPMALRPGEKATLSIRATADIAASRAPVVVLVTVQQTRQKFPITVIFAN